MRFEIGDRVVYIGAFIPKGSAGTVIAFDGNMIGVRFDGANSNCHTLNGRCENGYGWWCNPDNLEPEKKKREESMAKFKVGDLVWIVGPEDPDKVASSKECKWVPSGMKDSCGMVAEITYVTHSKGDPRYKLDCSDYYYAESWLKAYDGDTKPRFQKGDRVRKCAGMWIGMTATVMGYLGDDHRYLIRYDEYDLGWAPDTEDVALFKRFGIHVSEKDGNVYWYAMEDSIEPLEESGKSEKAGKSEKREKPRFKIGDRVIGNEKARDYGITKTGWVGYVTNIEDDGRIRVYRTMEHKCGYIVEPEDFDLCPEKDGKDPYVRRVVIEITQDGAKAKYIVGKKVEKEASIRRYHGDKPDDAKAAKFAVEALFGRLKADESAEYASRTAEALRRMDWGDILFKAFCEGTGGKK